MYDDLFKRSSDETFLKLGRLLRPKRLRNRCVNGERCFSDGNVSLLDVVTKNLANEARNVASDVRDNSREKERERES